VKKGNDKLPLMNTGVKAKILVLLFLMLGTGWIAWNYYDARYFLQWTYVVKEAGFLGLYRYAEKVAYMPLTPALFVAVYMLAEQLLLLISKLGFTVILQPIDYIRLIVKVPIVIANVIVGYVIYKEEGWHVARWWFYGIPIWTVIWQYQFDPLMVAFTVLGAYSLYKRRINMAAFLLGLGAAFKYVPLLIVPFILKTLKGLSSKLRFILTFSLPLILSILPFILFDFQDLVYKTLGFHISRYPQMLSLFNIPCIISNYNYVKDPIIGLLWIPLFAGSYLFMLWKLSINFNDKDSIMKVFALSTLLFIIFNKVNNPQYLLWSYPFLIYFIAREPRGSIKTLFIVSTIVGAVLYPALQFFPAAVLDRTVFIEEDYSWYSARILLYYSFEGIAKFIVSKVIYWIEFYGEPVLNWLYTNFNFIGASLILIYNSSLLFLTFYIFDNGKALNRIYEKIRGYVEEKVYNSSV